MALLIAAPAAADTLGQRFPAPPGCERVPLEPGSYGEYLRRFPLKPAGSEVHDHTGAVVDWGAELGAVLDVDLITTERYPDLQQCADLAIRLWAEFRWARDRGRGLVFTLQNGQRFPWRSWSDGIRAVVIQGRHRFAPAAAVDDSHAGLRAYLGYVMTWLGSAGIKAYATPVKPENARPGDLLVQNQTGAIGHVSILMDRCDRGADRFFLVAESYMPAQEGHVMLPAAGEGEGAWFTLEGLQRHLRHFGEGVLRRL